MKPIAPVRATETSLGSMGRLDQVTGIRRVYVDQPRLIVAVDDCINAATVKHRKVWQPSY